MWNNLFLLIAFLTIFQLQHMNKKNTFKMCIFLYQMICRQQVLGIVQFVCGHLGMGKWMSSVWRDTRVIFMQWNFRVTNYWLVHDYFDISCSPFTPPWVSHFPPFKCHFWANLYSFHVHVLSWKRHPCKTPHS